MSPIQEAAQTMALEAVRAHVESIGVVDMTDAGRLAGHLMTAEALLMDVAKAFAPAA
ncbi:hypothetical protein [Streptomyces clavifer]|uniref:hypothetical protein n=1 Tax=Streptomyces clavifer TaxID=68188 RepID=UPI003812C6CB